MTPSAPCVLSLNASTLSPSAPAPTSDPPTSQTDGRPLVRVVHSLGVIIHHLLPQPVLRAVHAVTRHAVDGPKLGVSPDSIGTKYVLRPQSP